MARPKKQDAIGIPRRAVEETIRLMEERGDFDVPLSEVADAVGCKAPALYGHFRNKNALLHAVHDEGFARLYGQKLAVAARTDGNAFERLRQGGYAYLRYALENPVLYRLMFTPPHIPEMEENPFATDVGRRSLDFLVQSIRACQTEGYLPDADPEQYAFTLWSAVHGSASLILQHRTPQKTKGDDVSNHAVDAIMAMIAATRQASNQESDATDGPTSENAVG